ncbi:MAG TPA: hypothetical protein VHF69_13430 [Candidatus Synoicihabitans sp.]|nr:hypothetical protein [Candidatus Synoicihabitans sp.]
MSFDSTEETPWIVTGCKVAGWVFGIPYALFGISLLLTRAPATGAWGNATVGVFRLGGLAFILIGGLIVMVGHAAGFALLMLSRIERNTRGGATDDRPASVFPPTPTTPRPALRPLKPVD